MTRVFISHGGADWSVVNPVATHLRELGYIVLGWESPGQDQLCVGSALQQLEAANVTVVVLAEQPAGVDVLREEISHAIQKDKGLVAVRVGEDVDTPDVVFNSGAEVLEWRSPDDVEYLPEAITLAERSARLLAKTVQRGAGSGAACARQLP